MKTKLSVIVCAIFFLFLNINSNAGGIKVISGSNSAFANEKVMNIQFDYSSFSVGKFKTEEEYTSSKVSDYNSKEPGKGDKWLIGWRDARKTKYEPKFEELLNKELQDKGIVYGANPSAKYTLTVKITFFEPGYNIGISSKPSYVSYEFIYAETANPSKEISKLSLEEVRGANITGLDFDVTMRVSESFAKGGKMLGNYLSK